MHLISLPIIVSQLSAEQFGFYDYILMIAVIVNTLITLEITQASARFYPELTAKKRQEVYTSTAFYFVLTASLLFMAICSIYAADLSRLLFSESKESTILVALAHISVTTLLHLTQRQLKWELNPKGSVTVGFINASTFLVGLTYFSYTNEITLDTLFLSSSIAAFFATLFSIYKSENSYRFKVDFDVLKTMLLFSSPLVLSGIGMYIAVHLDRFAILHFLDAEQLGYYSFASRFALISILVMTSIQSSLTPLIYKHSNEPTTPEKVSCIFNLFMPVFVFVSVGALLFSPEVVWLFGSEEYYSAITVLPVLVIASLINGMYIFFPGLFIKKKTKLISIVTLSSALLNVILNYLLIPVWGILGAAYATLISSILLLLLFYKLGNQHYEISYSLSSVVIITLSSLMVCFVNHDVVVVSLSAFIVKVLIVLALSLCLFYYIKKNGLMKGVVRAG
ncbi:oligosaccharide flippase family protein [Pseudoalteromonas luteoviolacea]|uniref:oligosaccharide flippase family protein n=1 Tax=Pseudoalteromonas luteoviolacea TaxID=43657 RepID=UPI001F3DB7F6